MNRRFLLTAALPLALSLAGCETDPSGAPALNLGDPVRRAALSALRDFGDLSVWRGNPGRAALAVTQLEFLADAMPTDPLYAVELSPLVDIRLKAARKEVREALGIAAIVPPAEVMATLRQVSALLEAGNAARAQAVVARTGFAPGLIEKLGNLPKLPAATIAASAVNQEITRLAGPGRR